jgi:predicted phosphodiesterase
MTIKNSNNIQFVSDVHLEYRTDQQNEQKWWRREIIPSAPYLILAGDIAPATNHFLPSFYKWCAKNFKKVIHVPGNHEYWDLNGKTRSVHNTDIYLEKLCNNYGIIYGQKKVVILEDDIPPIICCTLWCSPDNEAIVRRDYKYILDFTPAQERKINLNHTSFIANQVNNYQQKCIIVTHHSPLKEGTSRSEFENDPLEKSYTNDLPKIVDRSLCWIFGHTHFVCNIIRENGAIVCSNPIGAKSENLQYDRAAVLKLFI